MVNHHGWIVRFRRTPRQIEECLAQTAHVERQSTSIHDLATVNRARFPPAADFPPWVRRTLETPREPPPVCRKALTSIWNV